MFIPGPRPRATTWGLSRGFDPATDAKGLRRNLAKANKQLGPKGGGLAVLHTLVGDGPSITHNLARYALESLGACAIHDVYVCSSGRRWCDLRMEGPRDVCS